MANGWTPQRRARQAKLIRTWRPWERSTGPQSDEGKRRVAKNADRGGQRQALRAIGRLLKQHKLGLDEFARDVRALGAKDRSPP